jgi:hypothetical protein
VVNDLFHYPPQKASNIYGRAMLLSFKSNSLSTDP